MLLCVWFSVCLVVYSAVVVCWFAIVYCLMPLLVWFDLLCLTVAWLCWCDWIRCFAVGSFVFGIEVYFDVRLCCFSVCDFDCCVCWLLRLNFLLLLFWFDLLLWFVLVRFVLFCYRLRFCF